MIDINTPQSLAGLFLLVLAAFVVITVLITTGVLPAVLALLIGAAVLYVIYIVLMRIHRLFTRGSIRSSGDGGGGEA